MLNSSANTTLADFGTIRSRSTGVGMTHETKTGGTRARFAAGRHGRRASQRARSANLSNREILDRNQYLQQVVLNHTSCRPQAILPPELAAWLSDPGLHPGAKHLLPLDINALAQAEREDARKPRAHAGSWWRGRRALRRPGAGSCTPIRARKRACWSVLGRVAQAHPAAEFSGRAAERAGRQRRRNAPRRVASAALGKLDKLARRTGARSALAPRRWASASVVEKRSLADAPRQERAASARSRSCAPSARATRSSSASSNAPA